MSCLTCQAPGLPLAQCLPIHRARQELATDDMHYEAQKEQNVEKEKERRGAANALRGGEFMYL